MCQRVYCSINDGLCDGIADGALKAAEIAMARRQTVPQIAILVSCIGRKLVMNQG
jgi:hypothetical protein